MPHKTKTLTVTPPRMQLGMDVKNAPIWAKEDLSGHVHKTLSIIQIGVLGEASGCHKKQNICLCLEIGQLAYRSNDTKQNQPAATCKQSKH